jgi:hypothetical protein
MPHLCTTFAKPNDSCEKLVDERPNRFLYDDLLAAVSINVGRTDEDS